MPTFLSLPRPAPSWRKAASLWLGLMLALAATAGAYVLSGQRWPSNQPVVLDLHLGNPPGPLIDGSTTWNQVAAQAIGIWNPYLGSGVQLRSTENAVTPAKHDGKNSVFFSPTIFGDDFGDDTLGITITYYNPQTNLKTEADVLFNSAKSFDSYRGPQRVSAARTPVFDLRRVCIHEFGHVLGLDHVAQGTASIMTPVLTDLDTVQADDIAGLAAIYGAPGVAPAITGSLTATATMGGNFSYQIAATGSPTRYAVSVLPPGLRFDATTGELSGSPSLAGTYQIGLSATNASGTDTATLTLQVVSPPALTSSPQVSALLNTPFHYLITTTVPVSTFGVLGLPAGLNLDESTGLITGSPAAIGVFPLNILAGNPASGTPFAKVFLTVKPDTAVTSLHAFDGTDGADPNSALILAGDGNFYGTTPNGGVNAWGTFFRLSPAGTLTVLYTFNDPNPDSQVPSGLVEGADGSFYGVTTMGNGSVFKLTRDGTYTTLHRFTTAETGYGASAALTLGGDGALYGTTTHDLADPTLTDGSGGTAYKITPAGTLTFLHVFGTSAGRFFRLVPGADGAFYGTAAFDPNGAGNAFRLTPDGTVTTLHVFTGNEGRPCSPLVQAKDGAFYGTAQSVDVIAGTFYRLTPDGTVNVLHFFEEGDGETLSGVIQAADGDFYGVAGYYGTVGDSRTDGTLFKLDAGGTLTVLHHFLGVLDGSHPSAGLVQGADGEFYGTTFSGGPHDEGTIFKTALHAPPPTPLLPLVLVAATTPEIAAGSGGKGVFTLTLSEAQPTDLTVHYTVKGDAVNGTDYVALSGSKKIKAGKLTQVIKIKPLGDLGGAAKKSVKLTLTPDAAYTVGTTTAPKVKIVAEP